MVTLRLSDWLTLEVYHIMLVFVRTSAAFLLMPGFGEPTVPIRIRVLAGLAMAASVSPVIANMPQTVPDGIGLIFAVVAESVNGALLGTLARTMISAILTAGQIISQTVGLTNIFAAGVSIDQSPTVGAALYAGMLAILFAAHGHHLILRGLVDSYSLLPAAHFPDVAASAHAVVAAGLQSFRLAGQLSLPLLLLGLIFNATLAAVNRAMPAMPVFMIANPVLVIIGLYLIAATVPGIFDTTLSAWSDLPSLMR
jgi:flagellar biosynthetic protein FliR